MQVDVDNKIIKRELSRTFKICLALKFWLRGVDSNYRPLGYEPNERPTAPPRDIT